MIKSKYAIALSLIALTPVLSYADAYKQNALCVSGESKLCSTMPVDLPDLTVAQGYAPNTDSTAPSSNAAQDNFDWFSWQMFIALNWPADDQGQPISSPIGTKPEAPRVWQSWSSPNQVFPGNGLNTSSCAAGKKGLVLFRNTKFSTHSFIEPFTKWPLIDQAGNYVVYDIRMNTIEISYLQNNNLLTKAGQQQFTGQYNFPTGINSTQGATEIKTAWRILTDPKSFADYYTTPATIVVPKDNSVTGQEMCLDVTVGLVGMHIMQKITNPGQFSDFWVWATFEHTSNAPTAQGATPSQVNKKAAVQKNNYDPLASCPAPSSTSMPYAFYSPKCTNGGIACKPNQPPSIGNDKNFLWQPQPPYAKRYLTDGQYGTQVVRCWAIYDSANTVSSQFQTALSGTPWANYMLVGAQWAQASQVEFPSPVKPFAAPFYLTNTTLETYLQLQPIVVNGKPSTQAPGSCITCHNMATDSVNHPANFSFLPGYAK